MARYTDADCRLCRREGCKLFLKGERCVSKKCAIERRPTVPGAHGNGMQRRRQSEYALQLREKQKVKRAYGVLEKQFRKYYEEAERQKGKTGEVMLSLLERRLDNVVYRMGFAASRDQARQMVNHSLFLLNGKKANIPSILVKVGDVIAVKNTESSKIKELVESMGDRIAPKWLDVDKKAGSAKVVAMPERDDIDFEFNEQLIIELYSK